jgi:hypothetical protein
VTGNLLPYMDAIANDFGSLDAQDPISRMAQMTPEEMAEYNAFLDEQNARFDAQMASAEREMDSLLEMAYEARTDLGDFAD